MYAEKNGLTSWDNIGVPFINALFNDSVAAASGSTNADVMLNKIAYSALSSGTPVFGNTAIRAMFDDANELGKAAGLPYYMPGDDYQANPFWKSSSAINNSVTEITKILAQFAGKLATDKVVQSNSPTAVNGVLELSGDGEQLDIHLGNSLWGNTSNVVGKTQLLSNLLSSVDSVSASTIRSVMQSQWGSSADSVFDHVVLATKDSDITVNILTVPASGKVNLFVDGKGDNLINGSGGNDLLIGGEGISTISGGGGNDIIIGGGGKDILSGGAGNDIFLSAGGDGIDTITDAENGDKIQAGSTIISGTATVAGKDFYFINDKGLLKIGSDLAVQTGPDSAAIIKNFFKSTYDPNVDYSFMGITIPKLVDLDGDGIDDRIAAGDVSDTAEAARLKMLLAVNKSLVTDPLIIDLNGNGIALDSWQTSAALFDLDGNGTKENTGWTKANGDDVFLVIDKNSNGNIDNINEMFGNASTRGFVDLKSYDSNKDNIINSTDTQFSLLRLWNDKDADGTVDTGEMTTLTANGITSISLNSYANRVNINGNLQTAISTITKTDGTTRNIHEFSFSFDAPSFTGNPDASLPSTFKFNIESIMLPYSRGYGSVYSWQAAMTMAPTLLAMAHIPVLDTGSRATNCDAANDNEKMVNCLLTA